MKINVYENDPRFYNDVTFPENHGSFSVICYGINGGLKELGYYAPADDADWVILPSSLDINWQYKDKKSGSITVWETINSLTNHHIRAAANSKTKLIGMSDQVSRLYYKYGYDCSTLHCGCDTEFYKPTIPKSDIFTFLFINSSNTRSGLDLALQAFHKAFQNNDKVRLIVKDTNEKSHILQQRISELKSAGSNIEYVLGRWNRSQIRDLYSSSHVCLNVLRMTSWGFPLAESSACGCLSVAGDFEPTNILNRPEFSVLIKPTAEIPIASKLDELTNYWGLTNCYGGFSYPEEPLFYDYNIGEYAETLKNLFTNWNQYGNVDTRSYIVDNFRWVDTAKNLIKILEKA